MEIFLGKNIKFLREKQKLDQQELADMIGVPRSTLACWENSIRTPKLEQIVKLAEFFNTNLDIIYTDFENNNCSPSYPELTENDYKTILKEKGLMDEHDYIDAESLDKLLKIADMIESVNKKKED